MIPLAELSNLNARVKESNISVIHLTDKRVYLFNGNYDISFQHNPTS